MANDQEQFVNALHDHDLRLTRVEAHLDSMDSQITDLKTDITLVREDITVVREGVVSNSERAQESLSEVKSLKSGAQVGGWVIGTMIAVIGLMVAAG